MEFFLNGKKKSPTNEDPNQTVLQYVRGQGLTGSKLGCQEGGCGACTMTVSKWDTDNNKPKYYSINGCLVPLIALDGKHLITVEGIGTSDNMHPAQERIAKFHGSQCGFCTPGIVMSLYSLLRSKPEPSKEEISEAFEGNLCRCTGYKPIIDAAYTFSKKEPLKNGVIKTDASSNGSANGCAMGDKCCKLNGSKDGSGTNGTASSHVDGDTKSSSLETDFAYRTPNGLEYKPYNANAELLFLSSLKKHQYKLLTIEHKNTITYRPTTLDELINIKHEHPDCKLVAGASEVQIEQRIGGDEHKVSAYVSDIKELRTFEYVAGKGVIIGANIPLSKLEHKLEQLSEEIPREKSEIFRAITHQLKFFAGRQVRNCATPAGNIATASPIADLNPILTAANATLEIIDSSGKTKQLSMGDAKNPYFLSYRKTVLPKDSIITRILIPETEKGEIVRAYKQAKRKGDDISIVTSTMRATVKDGEITHCALVYGGVGEVTVLAKTSATLVGQELCDKLLETTLDALDKEFQLPYSVPGSMAVFRRSLVFRFFTSFINLCSWLVKATTMQLILPL